MSDLQLPARVPQGGEEVQLDARLGAQVALQVLGLVLHGGQSGQQQVRVLLHAAVLPQSLPRESAEHVGQREQLMVKKKKANRRQEKKGQWFPKCCVIHSFHFLYVWMDAGLCLFARGTNAPLEKKKKNSDHTVMMNLAQEKEKHMKKHRNSEKKKCKML